MSERRRKKPGQAEPPQQPVHVSLQDRLSAGAPVTPAAPTPSVPATPVTSPPPGPSRSARRAAARQVAEQQSRQRRRRTTVVTAVVAVLVVAAAVFVTHSATSKKPSATQTRTQTTLLFGIAEKGQPAPVGALLAADPKKSTASVLLLPSAVVAQVPGHGTLTVGKAFAFSPRIAASTVSDLIGVTVDHTWVLDRFALAKLVDRLGGVVVDVDVDVLGPKARNGSRPILVPRGHERLRGSAAVSYATYLGAGEPEVSRLPRLQQVLTGILAALPKDAKSAAAALSPAGAGAQLDWSPAALATFLALVQGEGSDLAIQGLPVKAIDTGASSTSYALDQAATTQLVDQTLADSVPASRRLTGNRVLVFNNVGTPGLGESVRAKLVSAGFVFLGSSNQLPFTRNPSSVLIFSESQAARDAGYRVAAALHLPASAVKFSAQPQSTADIIVILGPDYRK